MKAFASFLGSSRKRKVAVGPTPANDDRLSTVSSSMDQHILSAFPAPPSHDITTPSELAATIAHRFHNHPPETDIEYVASSNHLSMSQRSSESPSDSDASLSSFVRQKRSIPRMSVLNPERHGHHSRHEFESPRSPSTPPIVTSTPPTPHKSSAASDVTLLPSSASSIVSGKLPPVPGTPFASQARKTGTSGPRTSSRAAAGEPDFVLADPATNSSQLPISDLPHEAPQSRKSDSENTSLSQASQQPENLPNWSKDGSRSAPSTPRKSMARRAINAMLNTSTTVAHPPIPSQPSSGAESPYSSTIYLSKHTTPASSAVSLSAPSIRTPKKKPSIQSIARFQTGTTDTEAFSPADGTPLIPMLIPFPEETLTRPHGSNGDVVVQSTSTNAPTFSGLDNAFGSDWEFESLGEDPFRANSPNLMPVLVSKGTAPAQSVHELPTSAPSSTEMQQQTSSSRLGSKLHSLLHSRSSRTLDEAANGLSQSQSQSRAQQLVLPSATSHLASSVSAIPSSQLSSPSLSREPSDSRRTRASTSAEKTESTSSTSWIGRRRAKSFTSRSSPVPFQAGAREAMPPLPRTISSPQPMPSYSIMPSPMSSRPFLPSTLSSSSTAPPPTRPNRVHDLDILILEETALMSIDELSSPPPTSISSRERFYQGSGPETITSPALSATSSLTARGATSPTFSLPYGQSPMPSPLTGTFSMSGESTMPSTPMSHVTSFSQSVVFETRSRSGSAASIMPDARRSIRPSGLNASVGPGSSAASIRAMNTKRSMPELDGVWKGFLEEVEEDGVAEVSRFRGLGEASAQLGSSIHSRSSSPTKSVSGRMASTSGRRPRRATTSGMTAASGAAQVKELPPVPPISSAVGSRRLHVPPRLSLSSSVVSSANPSPASSVQNPISGPSQSWNTSGPSPAGSSSPLTPPFTPTDSSHLLQTFAVSQQSTRYSRPISTATASSTHTIKGSESAYIGPGVRPTQIGSMAITPTSPANTRPPAHVVIARSDPLRARSGSTAVTPLPPSMVRQESSSSASSAVSLGNDPPESNDTGSVRHEATMMGAREVDLRQGGADSYVMASKGLERADSSASGSPAPSAAASFRSAYSRTASSNSLAASFRGASRVNSSSSLRQSIVNPPRSHGSIDTRSQSSLASATRPHQDVHRTLSPRSSLNQLGSFTDSSHLTSNESSSLLSWRSELDHVEERFEGYRVTVVDGERSRASSRSTSMFGNDVVDDTITKFSSAQRHPSQSIIVSPPASPTKMITVHGPNGTLQLSPRHSSRQLRGRHSRESSVSSVSSATSSYISAGTTGKQQQLRATLPIGANSVYSFPQPITSPVTPPKSASPTKRMHGPLPTPLTPTPRRRSKAPSSASASVSSAHLASSRQQDAELMRAVRAMEADAEAGMLLEQRPPATEAPYVRTKHHRSLTPAAAETLARLAPVGRPIGLVGRSGVVDGAPMTGRPEMHARSKSHDVLAATPLLGPVLRDRSSSHPNIGEDFGYAV